jgi:hypothetical protein
MTITTETTSGAGPSGAVTFDLYRDIHKGIRAELFRVTRLAGCTDPADASATQALAGEVRTLVALLVSHAEHEDGEIQPSIEAHLPELGAQVLAEHGELEARIASLADLAEQVAAGGSASAAAAARLYLDLASFVSAYLLHQDLEERVIMPALEAAVGVEAVIGMHERIIASLSPEEMAQSLAIMLPAMNADDRTGLLGGIRAGAPAEVFAGIWGLAGSVLSPEDLRTVGVRLGIA